MPGYAGTVSERRIWGFGVATIAGDGSVLDCAFPEVVFGEPNGDNPLSGGVDELRDVRIEPITVAVSLDEAPSSTADVYVRLHALSRLLVRPNELNLDGIFGLLPTVAFTTRGPMLPQLLSERRLELQRAGVSVVSVDKFPRLLDYVVPAGVRIADANRVRLGAHLAPGTTVMHEGFVNFNAGTLGASMVEGRISQGVVVGDGSDIGGGASIMGTLSGGGTERVSIGKRCLLGANAGLGISLGDDCVVEAGLYLTAASKVSLRAGAKQPDGSWPVVKATTLSGRSGLLYRRNSQSGQIEALPREGVGVQLNAALHA